MSRFAILSPTTLLGKELRETLERRAHRDTELVLLSTREEEVGTLTEALGAAAVVTAADPDAFDGVDVIFACGEFAAERELLQRRPPGVTAVVLSPEATVADGRPIFAGLNTLDVAPGELLLSPHPGAQLLAQVLAPLVPLGLAGVAATVIQPVSLFGERALEELFEQTRNIVALVGAQPSMFERQLAFNVYPAPDATPGHLTELLRASGVFPAGLPLAVQVLQGGVFHGVSASIYARFSRGVELDALRATLSQRAHLAFTDEEEDDERSGPPGPVEAAAREEILLGGLRAEAQGVWLWAVLDNLTRGGAIHALDLAAAVTDLPQA